MAANSSIDLITLDFDSNKTSLRNFFRNQDRFKDYDFDSSNMSVFLDILSYNTFKNGFYINMAIAESFLDSAQLRNSVESHSKELNYLPRSKRSAVAKIRVNFQASGESQPYTIEKGSTFTTQIKNQSYTFSIPETIIVSSTNSTFSFVTDIYEGVYQKNVYVVDNISEILRYRILDTNVDSTSITVTVFDDGSTIGKKYTYATNMLGINANSRVFFLQCTDNGFYEVIFGDGVIGTRPKLGSKIVLDYRVSEEAKANGAKFFVINFDPTASGSGDSELDDTPSVTTLIPSNNGKEAESIESIRYYAPRHFQVQERAITESDYEIMLQTQFPEINAVSAFGGEELDPPQYGRVFIAVDINDVEGFPEYKKREYFNFIRQKNSKTIEPVFIDPEFTFVNLRCAVNYNINVTDQTPERIKTLIASAIDDYSDTFLNDFKVSLRFSKLQGIIDNSDPSIVSNELSLLAFKKIIPEPDVSANFVLNFNFRLSEDIHSHTDSYPIVGHETIVSSSRFRRQNMTCVIHDDGKGILRIMKVGENSYDKIMNIGSVNYKTGRIAINRLLVQTYEGAALKIFVRPATKDIQSSKNTIMTINAEDVNITTRAMRL